MEVYSGNEPYIFVSYAHKDSQIVVPILEQMQSAGFRLWYDKGIEAGTEWPQYIAEHLAESSCVMVFMSSHSADSHNCRNEINLASELKKEMLVVYLEDFEMALGLRLQLNLSQALYKTRHKSDSDFYNELFKARILQRFRENGDTAYQDNIIPENVTTSGNRKKKRIIFLTIASFVAIFSIVLVLCVTQTLNKTEDNTYSPLLYEASYTRIVDIDESLSIPCLQIWEDGYYKSKVKLNDDLQETVIEVTRVDDKLSITLDGSSHEFQNNYTPDVYSYSDSELFSEIIFYDLNNDGYLDVIPVVCDASAVQYPNDPDVSLLKNYSLAWCLYYDGGSFKRADGSMIALTEQFKIYASTPGCLWTDFPSYYKLDSGKIKLIEDMFGETQDDKTANSENAQANANVSTEQQSAIIIDYETFYQKLLTASEELGCNSLWIPSSLIDNIVVEQDDGDKWVTYYTDSIALEDVSLHIGFRNNGEEIIAVLNNFKEDKLSDAYKLIECISSSVNGFYFTDFNEIMTNDDRVPWRTLEVGAHSIWNEVLQLEEPAFSKFDEDTTMSTVSKTTQVDDLIIHIEKRSRIFEGKEYFDFTILYEIQV